MTKSLEKHIKSIRNELDVEYPDHGRIWNGIRDEIGNPVRRILIRASSIAAACVILFIAGYFLIQTHVNKSRETYLSKYSDELAAQHRIYKAAIDTYYLELKSKEYDKEKVSFLFDELEHLDALDEEYLKDLKEVGPNERLIHAMLENYEKRIKILQKILYEINKTNEYENYRTEITS